MRIAIATEDGRTISRHFGRAMLYAVLTVEDGGVVLREIRDKSTPHGSGDVAHVDDEAGGPHGTGPSARDKHLRMFGTVTDCAAVIAGGMGTGAYDHAVEAGLRPYVTSMIDIDEAAIACEAGRLVDEVGRLH